MQPMLNIALRAARGASEFIFRSVERLSSIKTNEEDSISYINSIDLTAAEDIRLNLSRTYPNHGFSSAKEGLYPGSGEGSDYLWIIEPIGSTLNFLHGLPNLTLSISCKYQNRLEHAVILDLVRREEFTASRGRGARLDGRRLRVSTRNTLEGSLLGMKLFPCNNQSLSQEGLLKILNKLLPLAHGIYSGNPTNLDMAYLAAGRIDAFLGQSISVWEGSAGMLLIQEAGGLISDFQGSHNFLGKGDGIVASNPRCLKSVLKVIHPYV